MTDGKKKYRFTVAGNLPGSVCTRKQASHLLQRLRGNYQLLSLEEKRQVKTFVLGLIIRATRAAIQPTTGRNRK